MELKIFDHDRNNFLQIVDKAKQLGYIEENKTLITFGERGPDEKIISAQKNGYKITILEGHKENCDNLKVNTTGIDIINERIEDYVFSDRFLQYDICWWYHGPEHLEKELSLKILKEMRKHCNVLLISMPHGIYDQDGGPNSLETHRSAFYPEDFSDFGNTYCFAEGERDKRLSMDLIMINNGSQRS